MKRLILLLFLAVSIIGTQAIINCSKPLDSHFVVPDPDSDPIDKDTVFVFDTVFVIDTIVTVDTIFAGDTTFIYDTIISLDTVIVVDTIFAGDTVIVVDTLIYFDTVISIDTIFATDTIIMIDTMTITDTLVDTVVDTVVQTDTVIIVDTLTISPTYCASLSSSQKTVTWMLQNHAGTYRLEFVASGDNNDPKEELTIEIGDEEYEWRPYVNPEIVLELDLNDDARTLIYSSAPHAFGHPLDICLKIEKQ